MLSKEIYMFNASSIKIPMALFIKIILKFIWKHKRPRIDKGILSKNILKISPYLIPSYTVEPQ